MPDPTNDPLPREILVPANRVAIQVYGLVALIVLIVANVGAVYYLRAKPVISDADASRRQWEKINTLDEPLDWMILGDSTCLIGVDPTQVERELGGATRNLCTFFDLLLVDDAWMLQRHIERVGPPENVILGVAESTWAGTEEDLRKEVLAQIPLEGAFWDRYVPAIDLSGQVDTYRSQLRLPLWFDHGSVASRLRDPRHWITPPANETRGMRLLDDTHPDKVEEQITTRRDELRQRDASDDRPPVVSALNAAAFQEIVRLADEYDFDVYVVPPPLPEELADDPLVQEQREELAAAIEELAGDSDHVKVLLTDSIGFDPGDMWDAAHVASPAVEEYTQYLVDRIEAARD